MRARKSLDHRNKPADLLDSRIRCRTNDALADGLMTRTRLAHRSRPSSMICARSSGRNPCRMRSCSTRRIALVPDAIASDKSASSGQGVRMPRRRSSADTGLLVSACPVGSGRQTPSEFRPIRSCDWLPSMSLVSFVLRKSFRTRRQDLCSSKLG